MGLDLAPHKVNVCFGGCADDRFVNHHPNLISSMDGGFNPNMLGGAACVFSAKFRDAFVDQFVDSYRILPFKKIALVVHFDCGWLNHNYESVSQYVGFDVDPANIEHLLTIGERAGRIIQRRLKEEHGVDIPVNVLVPAVVNDADTTEIRILADQTFWPESSPVIPSPRLRMVRGL